jgi:hypothetical protein
MAHLILHVGPGKCGSSSIQQFFTTQKNPCVQKVRYLQLDPGKISEINIERPGASIIAVFTRLLSDNLHGCDVLILSREYLFQCPYAVKNICNLARGLATRTSIVGYSRRQSDFLVSAYSQWFFRSPQRVQETTGVLEKSEIDPVLFSGLERQLIASILDDFYSARQLTGYNITDWYHSYQNISKLIDDPAIAIKCGVLPGRESSTSLIQDFCEKCGLTLRSEMHSVGKQIVNVSFHQDIIEAMNSAVDLGLGMPGPHEDNEILDMLSAKMVKIKNGPSDFLTHLKAYIDSFFLSSNQQLCKEYGLAETYFAPAVQLSKNQILDIILNESRQRALNKSVIINDYRKLSAQLIALCLDLAKRQQT